MLKILLKRTYFRDAYTVGYIHIKLSGEYDSDVLNGEIKTPPWKNGDMATLEPHAIAWEDKPLIGQKAGQHIYGKTAIPEGTYRVVLMESKTFKRKMPVVLGVPGFKTIVLRTGKTASQTKGDILVGKLAPVESGHPSDNPLLEDSRKSFNFLFSLIEEAIDYGETVWLTVRSPREWTFPKIRKQLAEQRQ